MTPQAQRFESEEHKRIWTQIFCAALTGVMATQKEPFRQNAFDAVTYAASVADEAFQNIPKLAGVIR